MNIEVGDEITFDLNKCKSNSPCSDWVRHKGEKGIVIDVDEEMFYPVRVEWENGCTSAFPFYMIVKDTTVSSWKKKVKIK